MDARSESERNAMKNPTTLERTSDRELVVTRTINGPARIVFEAWTKAELFQKWWVPPSAPVALLSCEMDVRVGGGYKLVFGFKGAGPGAETMAVFGKYTEVTPHSRLVWTNDEAGEAGQVTTVTFQEKAGKTLVVMRDLYPSKEALDEAIAAGATAGEEGNRETFDQLQELVATLSS